MSLTPTPEETREHSIESWMLTIVRDGGVARRDDLHVDRIDKAWKPPDCWVRSGLDAFRMASELRDRHQLPFIVALGFSLQSGDYPTGIDFRNPEELSEKLDWSPPSLYLFEPGKTPRSDTTDGVIHELTPTSSEKRSDRRIAITSSFVGPKQPYTPGVCSWKDRVSPYSVN